MSANRCKARTKSGRTLQSQTDFDGFCSIHSDPERAASSAAEAVNVEDFPQSEPIPSRRRRQPATFTSR